VLVLSPVFKTGVGRREASRAGSIPVHYRHYASGSWRRGAIRALMPVAHELPREHLRQRILEA